MAVFVAREVSAEQTERSAPTCGENQPRYRRHPSSADCQLYVACVTGPDGRYVPVVMRCLLGLQWDDQIKMCVTDSRTCHHVTDDDHAHRHFDASWLPAETVFHRRQPALSDDQRRHQLRHHFGRDDVTY